MGPRGALGVLLVVFMVIYLVALAAYLVGAHALLAAVTGVAAAGGALFVLSVVHLGYETIKTLNSAVLAEKIEAQKSEGMLRELTTTNERITNSNRALEQFAYATSHDLQEPLRKITAFGDSLVSTETAALEPRCGGPLRELADAGVRIALDDFGTGFSGLSTLRDFPFGAIKLDRSFISALHKTPRERALVQTMVLMGKTMGLEVVAEGLETEAELNAVAEMGANSGQGYFLGRPQTAAAVAQLLRKP
jgi:signal transduction histidine kinase